jgi:hypothetical protein
MRALLGQHLQRYKFGLRSLLQRHHQIAQFKKSLNGNVRSAKSELHTVRAEHPGRKTAGGFVGKPDENAIALPVLKSLLHAKGAPSERVPWVIDSDLLKNVCIM